MLKQFGEKYFDEVAYINFEQNPRLSSVFDTDLNPLRIIKDLENLILSNKIEVGKTLLILMKSKQSQTL